jgi:hypothetical protein
MQQLPGLLMQSAGSDAREYQLERQLLVHAGPYHRSAGLGERDTIYLEHHAGGASSSRACCSPLPRRTRGPARGGIAHGLESASHAANARAK